jgi:hypothetical protein
VKRNYLSYLLRIWQTGGDESRNWVASLEDPHSHQITHFNSLDALAQYLLQSPHRLGTRPAPDGEETHRKTR